MVNGGLAFVMSGCAAAGVATFILVSLPGDEYWPYEVRSQRYTCGDGNSGTALDDFRASWYASHLRAAGERSIVRASSALPAQTRRTVRFTWLRSFDAPVIVRAETDQGGATTLTATELTGAGGYEPGTVARRIVRVLTPVEGERLEGVIERSRVFEQPPGECSMMTDGAQWISEADDSAGYRFVDRQSPQIGPSREFGMHMLNLTGWRFDRIY